MAQAQSVLADALGLAPTEARIEAQVLLKHGLGDVARAWLIAHEHDPVAAKHEATFKLLLHRRLEGEPVAYILGEREFFGLMFKVTPATLIPRPETELLVELALRRIPSPPSGCPPTAMLSPPMGEGGRQTGSGSEFRVLDLGTGSGAIALSLAHARPGVEFVAVDVSPDALAVAYENAQRLGISNISFMQSNWYAALDTQLFDLIVSNPPYVAVGDAHLRHGDLRFEPLSALSSGEDGLDDIRRIVSEAPVHLKPGGWLLFEHGYDQAAKVRELLQLAGFNAIFSACDLAGIERVSGGCVLT